MDLEQVQPILHEMGSDQRIFQDKIMAPIWVHLQHLIEGKNPKQNMAIQTCDILTDQ
jgi:hypothetical protein